MRDRTTVAVGDGSQLLQRQCEVVLELRQEAEQRDRVELSQTTHAEVGGDLEAVGAVDLDRGLFGAVRDPEPAPPQARAAKSEGLTGLTITEGGGQSSIRIEPQAWGEFDGDSVDDLALSVTNSMTHGSALSVRLVVVTRKAPAAVLRVLPIEPFGAKPP